MASIKLFFAASEHGLVVFLLLLLLLPNESLPKPLGGKEALLGPIIQMKLPLLHMLKMKKFMFFDMPMTMGSMAMGMGSMGMGMARQKMDFMRFIYNNAPLPLPFPFMGATATTTAKPESETEGEGPPPLKEIEEHIYLRPPKPKIRYHPKISYKFTLAGPVIRVIPGPAHIFYHPHDHGHGYGHGYGHGHGPVYNHGPVPAHGPAYHHGPVPAHGPVLAHDPAYHHGHPNHNYAPQYGGYGMGSVDGAVDVAPGVLNPPIAPMYTSSHKSHGRKKKKTKSRKNKKPAKMADPYIADKIKQLESNSNPNSIPDNEYGDDYYDTKN